jgi:ATP-dependent Lhr-like helicase
MLVSRLVEHRIFFAQLRAVVVDEVHAFAGDDRGWHMLALLERLKNLTAHHFQRIALSATLGNAAELLEWLVAGRDEPRQVVEGVASPGPAPDVQVDHVGNLANAATVISRLHRGAKRLVFCDSRTQVESLASELRRRSVTTFVSHSSLSRDERLRAEAAFSQGHDCVIVATSTLELGIDVGDLDRVIQIDAPYSVASFLQRLGRAGRRAGANRNCLFLATSDESFLRALGIARLWRHGYVEPVEPPALPFHVAAQQILALTLQEGEVPKPDYRLWLGNLPRTAGITEEDIERILAFMLEELILVEDGGLITMGPEGESRYGHRNFLDLFSVFLSPPLFQVLHGRVELGQVHESTFRRSDRKDGPMLLSLGGRGWQVTHIDWAGKRAYVESADQAGRSKWFGTGQPMRFELCNAVKEVLADDELPDGLSVRGRDRLTEVRELFSWVELGVVEVIEEAPGRWRCWTFGGDRLNAALAGALQREGLSARYDSYSVAVDATVLATVVELFRTAIARLPELSGRERNLAGVQPEVFKFADVVPPDLLVRLIRVRGLPGGEDRRRISGDLRVRSSRS